MTQLPHSPRSRRPHRRRSGEYGKRQRPEVRPGDFRGLKLLAYGDSSYQYGWDVAPVVIWSHKLIFWTIPKVACTVFKKAFRRLEGYNDWMIENNVLPHNPSSNGLNYLFHFKPFEADDMLTDKQWTRAIFVRDPKERLLSAYLDKVVSNHSYYIRHRCCRIKSIETLLECDKFRASVLHSEKVELSTPAVTFEQFLKYVYPDCSDPHWIPQADRIPDNYWQFINFVGHVDRVKEDSETLFKRVGAWEKLDSSEWPSGSMFSETNAHHATFAKSKMKEYYTPELEAIVERIHRADYRHPFLNLSLVRYTAT